MAELCLHRGGQLVPKDDLRLVPVPPQTESYQPVGHYELAKSLTTIGQDILKDYVMVSEQYALARQGNQLFAILNFRGESPDMALSIGFRNSYDKSMSIGICMGASVFVCDNLALHGEIAVMKRHTTNLLATLEDLAITTLYKAQYTFQKLIKDAGQMRARALTNDQAFRMMGLLYGREILSPRQLPVVLENWVKPKHAEFQPRNAWSFYNSCTEALKSCQPLNIMERHIRLHHEVVGEVIDV